MAKRTQKQEPLSAVIESTFERLGPQLEALREAADLPSLVQGTRSIRSERAAHQALKTALQVYNRSVRDIEKEAFANTVLSDVDAIALGQAIQRGLRIDEQRVAPEMAPLGWKIGTIPESVREGEVFLRQSVELARELVEWWSRPTTLLLDYTSNSGDETTCTLRAQNTAESLTMQREYPAGVGVDLQAGVEVTVRTTGDRFSDVSMGAIQTVYRVPLLGWMGRSAYPEDLENGAYWSFDFVNGDEGVLDGGAVTRTNPERYAARVAVGMHDIGVQGPEFEHLPAPDEEFCVSVVEELGRSVIDGFLASDSDVRRSGMLGSKNLWVRNPWLIERYTTEQLEVFLRAAGATMMNLEETTTGLVVAMQSSDELAVVRDAVIAENNVGRFFDTLKN